MIGDLWIKNTDIKLIKKIKKINFLKKLKFLQMLSTYGVVILLMVLIALD